MSAITGIFYRDGRNVDPQLIKKMNDILSHRGPDGSATWCEGPVGLGHQMLWTTPESLQETLPLEEDGLVITADARIDNRAELSPELGIEDAEHVSDSYFILKAYQKWGEDCPDKLLGDFAFVIWDKNKEQLFCARDHMGVKPFYYYLDDDMFVFGTEIKAILKINKLNNGINETKISFFLMGISDQKSTFYENIFTLLPANFLNVGFNHRKLSEYWHLNPHAKIVMDSEEDYSDAFFEIFSEAIKCRLRSSLPIAFELSGGLDSSSVVCTAKTIADESNFDSKKIETFSFIFEKYHKCNEKYFIKKINYSKDFKAHFINGDNISPFKQMEEILEHHDQPIKLPNLAILWQMYEKMQERNIRIVLCGTGGDAVVSHGNKYFRDLFITLRWHELLKEFNCYANHYNLKFYNLRFYYYFFLHVSPSFIKFIRKILNPNMVELPGIDILNKDFSKKVCSEKAWYLEKKSIKEVKTAKKYHYTALNHNNSIFNALITRDSLTSAFKIEGRYPFLDKRMVEFCYAIPTEMKFKFGWSRYILRIAMEGILPVEIQWRENKANLSPVFKTNILLLEKPLLEEIINSKNKIIHKYVNLDLLKNIYNKFLDKKEVSDSGYTIFLICELFLWIRLCKNKLK